MNMKKMKKMIALAGMTMLLYGGAQGPAADNYTEALPFLCSRAQAAEPAWLDDINAASSDDTMAYGIYIGKPIKEVIDAFENKGWTRADQGEKVIFIRDKGNYKQMVAIHPNISNADFVGSYRIRFQVKDKTEAEDMYMHAEKNFSYNFGRPTFTKGSDNKTWVLNESFAIVVEFNEYNAKIAEAKDYPYEVVIKRELGDYKQFLLPGQQ